MKSYIKSIVAVFIGILFLYSCKKSDTIQNTLSTKVKTYSEEVTNFGSTSGDTFNVVYDIDNRVISLISPFSEAQFLYTYTSNSTYTFDIKNGPHLVIREFNYINSNSFVDSSFQYNDTNDSTTMKFIYNSNNQLIEQKTYTYSLPVGAVMFRKNKFVYDSQGNLFKNFELTATGDTNMITTYTYTNIIGNTFSLATIYYPTLHKYLPETITNYYPSSNTTVLSTLTYVFDNYNRVIKETQTNSAGNYSIKKYDYY